MHPKAAPITVTALHSKVNAARERARTRGTPVRINVADRLFVEVRPNGGASWVFRYSVPRAEGGSRKTSVGLGAYGPVTLAEARERAQTMRKHLDNGVDPVHHTRGALRRADRQRQAEALTVGIAVERWLAQHLPEVSEDYGKQQGRRLADVLDYSSAGHMPLRNIPIASAQTAQIAHALGVFTERKEPAADTAHKVLGDLRRAFDWARGKGWRAGENPCAGVGAALPRRKKSAGRRAPNVSELGAVAQAIRSARRPVEFDYSAKLTELLLLTGARTREVRLAQWDEVKELDGERPRIEVPADRMKRREAWTVLLSKQAVALLKEIRANAELYERVEPYIFFRYSGAGSGSVCSENSVNEFLERIGLHGSITGHGFRKLFSTAAHSFWMFAGPNRNKAIEHSLAHVNKDTVEGVYNRSDYFAERAILMQWWADHLDVLCSDQSARVIPFSKTA